jgi:hypothetical protein
MEMVRSSTTLPLVQVGRASLEAYRAVVGDALLDEIHALAVDRSRG